MKNKHHQGFPSYFTRSVRTPRGRVGSSPSPAEKSGVWQPGLSVGPLQPKARRRRGSVVKPLSWVERQGEQGHLRPESRGRRRGGYRPLRPHQRVQSQPSPPRARTHGPARARPQQLRRTPGSRSPGGGLAGSLLPTATASGSGPAAGERRQPGEGGRALGQGGSGTPQRRRCQEPVPVTPAGPTAPCGPSTKPVARE